MISMMMAYVFNAMTHIAIDIRLMAFKFFELIVISFPSSFLLYAEKVHMVFLGLVYHLCIFLTFQFLISVVLFLLFVLNHDYHRCQSGYLTLHFEQDQYFIQRVCNLLHFFQDLISSCLFMVIELGLSSQLDMHVGILLLYKLTEKKTLGSIYSA